MIEILLLTSISINLLLLVKYIEVKKYLQINDIKLNAIEIWLCEIAAEIAPNKNLPRQEIHNKASEQLPVATLNNLKKFAESKEIRFYPEGSND